LRHHTLRRARRSVENTAATENTSYAVAVQALAEWRYLPPQTLGNTPAICRGAPAPLYAFREGRCRLI